MEYREYKVERKARGKFHLDILASYNSAGPGFKSADHIKAVIDLFADENMF